MKSYGYQAELFVKNYLLADAVLPYTSALCGIFMCKMVYDLTQLISSANVKSYSSLTKIQRTEWNIRGMSSTHAIFITVMSSYFVFISDIFSKQLEEPVTLRSSNLSTFILGVSMGYFISDLAILFWLYPALGGLEFVLHHSLAICAIAYAVLTGEGQIYSYMVLISESTTPEINIRWFLDTAGMKRSAMYLINGVMLFFTWLVTRILLFIYFFYHMYRHYNEVMQMYAVGYFLAFATPLALLIMNILWFSKILKGLRKTLAKRQ